MKTLSKPLQGTEYNAEYFENGIASGKSCYTNYRWMPELTIKLAHKMIQALDVREEEKVLDFGCAKGYLVKAMRILDIQAYGCDVSKYALSQADPEIKEYCKLIRMDGKVPFNFTFDWTIAKDVFEHVSESQLETVLKGIGHSSKNLFAVIPLGDGKDKFVVPAYSLDITHKTAKTKDWWEDKFIETGWNVKASSFIIPGIKKNWEQYSRGNGYFILSKP